MRALFAFPAAWLLALIVAGPAYADRAHPLRVAVEANRPPFAYRAVTGVLSGFDVTMAQALCRQMKRPCLLTDRPLFQAMEDLEHGNLDMIVSGVVPTADLQTKMDFTDRYYRAVSIFVGKADGGNLADKRIGVLMNTPQQEFLLDKVQFFKGICSSSSLSRLWDMLHSGNIDAVLIDHLLAYAFLTSPQGKTYDTLGLPITFADLPGTHCIAVGKRKHALLRDVNQALLALRRDGTYIEASYRFFSIDID